MGLRDNISQAVTRAFDVSLSDIPVDCEYISYDSVNPEYDPETGVITRPPFTQFNIKAVFDEITEELVADVPIQLKDMIMLFPSSYVPIIPQINDHVIVSSKTYHVMAFITDPAEAHYSLHLRPLDV